MQAAALWNAINQRSILLPAVFVFLWQVWLLRVVQAIYIHQIEHIAVPNCWLCMSTVSYLSLDTAGTASLQLMQYPLLHVLHADFVHGHILLTDQYLGVNLLTKYRLNQ